MNRKQAFLSAFLSSFPVGKIAKKHSEGVKLRSTQITVPNYQKYTPKDRFFGDFAHLVTLKSQ